MATESDVDISDDDISEDLSSDHPEFFVVLNDYFSNSESEESAATRFIVHWVRSVRLYFCYKYQYLGGYWDGRSQAALMRCKPTKRQTRNVQCLVHICINEEF